MKIPCVLAATYMPEGHVPWQSNASMAMSHRYQQSHRAFTANTNHIDDLHRSRNPHVAVYIEFIGELLELGEHMVVNVAAL